jgi:tetratricopeptide (TPR) repeat protein
LPLSTDVRPRNATTTDALRRPAFALFVIAVMLAVPVPRSSAQRAPDDSARGQAAYARGDYSAALRAWETAYRRAPTPRLQLDIARAHEQLGQPAEARMALDRYLSTAPPDDPHRAEAQARLASLRDRGAATARAEDDASGARPAPIGGPRGSGTDAPIGAILALTSAGLALIGAGVLSGMAIASADSARAPDDENATAARGSALGADVCFGVSLAGAIGGMVLAIVETSQPGDERAGASWHVRPIAGASAAGLGATVEF